MDYYTNPPDPEQKSPIEPHSIISGGLPGSTEIRLGNNIKISGKNQQILVTTTGGNVVIGSTSDGRLAMEATNSDGSKVGIGTIPNTTNLGLYSIDPTSHTTMTLGKQSDGANALKFFDSSNVGLAQFGKYADGNTALKVAKAGIEVGTATNDQLIFNSGQNIFKIVNSFTINNNFSIVSTAFQSNLVTQAHGMSFTPAYLAFITLDNNLTLAGTSPSQFASTPAVVEGSVAGNITIFTYATVTVDATNIYFQIDVAHYAAVAVSNSVKVYLMQETFS